VKAWFTWKLDYSPPVVDLAEAGFPLIGGRIDMLDQRPVAAIVYQHGNHWINLFVWPVASRKLDLAVQSDRGYRFCGWNKAGLNYLCISETSSIALEAFEDQVREHTNLLMHTPASISRFSGPYEISHLTGIASRGPRDESMVQF
jgi:anti-sigma factor RsiW